MAGLCEIASDMLVVGPELQIQGRDVSRELFGGSFVEAQIDRAGIDWSVGIAGFGPMGCPTDSVNPDLKIVPVLFGGIGDSC
jgi:hypothetical protein